MKPFLHILSRFLTILISDPYVPYAYSKTPNTCYPLATDHPTNTSIICNNLQIAHYLNLQIEPTVSQTQVASAYRGLIRLLHPDKEGRGRGSRESGGPVDEYGRVVDEEQNRRNKVRAYALVRKAWAILGVSAKRQAYTFADYFLEDYDWDEDDELNEDPFERLYKSLGGVVKEKRGRGRGRGRKGRGDGDGLNLIVERVEGYLASRLDCRNWVMGKERLVYYGDEVDGDLDVDVDVSKLGKEIKNDWKCWELALRHISYFVRNEGFNGRRSLWEKSGSPYPHSHSLNINTTDYSTTNTDPIYQENIRRSFGVIPSERDRFAYMFGSEEEERKPWFWDYKIVPRKERKNCWSCTVGWVNLVHGAVDNLVAREWSDRFWAWAEGCRRLRRAARRRGVGGMEYRSVKGSSNVEKVIKEEARKRELLLLPKTLTFWEKCESFDVVIWVREEEEEGYREIFGVGLDISGELGMGRGLGIGNGRNADRWSNRRSDTRWSTLGEDLVCWDLLALKWMLIGWMGWVLAAGCWWVVTKLWWALRKVWIWGRDLWRRGRRDGWWSALKGLWKRVSKWWSCVESFWRRGTERGWWWVVKDLGKRRTGRLWSVVGGLWRMSRMGKQVVTKNEKDEEVVVKVKRDKKVVDEDETEETDNIETDEMDETDGMEDLWSMGMMGKKVFEEDGMYVYPDEES